MSASLVALILALAFPSSDVASYSDSGACMISVWDASLALCYAEDEPLSSDVAVCSEFRTYCDVASTHDAFARSLGCDRVDFPNE